MLAKDELIADDSAAGFDGGVGAGGDDPQLINNKSGAKPARRDERLWCMSGTTARSGARTCRFLEARATNSWLGCRKPR
ncbi:MAG TPA: hypothetical protein VLT58_14725, partial [Polyangia bacterium]|nr:hypothetical protein [Polyangia bacterium]